MPPSNKPATPTDHCMISTVKRAPLSGIAQLIPPSNSISELLFVVSLYPSLGGMTFNQFEEPSFAIPCILSESESSHVDLRPSLSECAAAARTSRPQLQARAMILTDASYSLLALCAGYVNHSPLIHTGNSNSSRSAGSALQGFTEQGKNQALKKYVQRCICPSRKAALSKPATVKLKIPPILSLHLPCPPPFYFHVRRGEILRPAQLPGVCLL